MIRSGVLCGIVTLFAATLQISAVKHWRVTENGRIQPQHDSVFDMRRPDDLPPFLEQEKRREKANVIYKKISRKEVSIDNQFMGLGMADVESSNSDCFLWDRSLFDVDVHASIVFDHKLRDGIDQSDHMLYNVATDGKHTVPDCQSTFSLDFSVYTFEHLKAMQNRKNLTQRKEIGLTKYLPTSVDQFGHQLAYSLSRNKTSWIYLNLASIYWRIKGNTYNALECSRRAIVSASRQYRDIPLVTTAGILHAAKYSGEAAIILHAAIDHNPMESYHHLALGHVYASLGDFSRSLACYNNCLKLSPETAEAKQMKNAIVCHRLLETNLLLFDQRLQNVLSEIRAYHDLKEEWFKLYEHMLWEQDIKPATREIKLAFAREQNVHSLGVNPIEKSVDNIDDNVMSYMDLGDRKKIAENMLQNVHLSLQLLKNMQKQMKKELGRNHVTQDTVAEVNADDKHSFALPMNKPKYQDIEIKKGKEDFEAEDWPKISDCEGPMLIFSDEKQYLPVYLSPENKGYATHLFVNELIDIEAGKKHPLPWRPPICQTPKSYNNKYITRIVLNATVQQHSSDVSLKSLLHNLAQTADLPEIGQRILTATERKVTTPWVLSMLASLYWRVVGKPRLALDCLQLALNGVPSEFRDVPLVSIASIHHKMGLIDDALKITNKVLQINAVEPMTNFLFGILLNVKGNYTGAMYYLKQALRVDPHLYEGRALMLLKTLACREKFTVTTGNKPETNNDKIRLPDKSRHKKHKKRKQEMPQDPARLLPNSATKLREYMDTSKAPDINVLRLFTDWTFDKIPDQKDLYYSSKEECDMLEYENLAASLFIFHEFLRRNMTIEDQIESLGDDSLILQPTCNISNSKLSQKSEVMRLSRSLRNNPELNMADWLTMISGAQNETLQTLGTKIAFALQKNYSSWTLAIAASAYWRVVGNSRKAFDCMCQSLEHSPRNIQDIIFVNMVSLLSSQNYFEEAFDVAQIALSIAPNFVVNHYVVANLYAATGEFESAASYYKSTLELEPNFEPAIMRLRVIQCFLLYKDKRSTMSKILWNIL